MGDIFGIFTAAAPLPGERRRKRHELTHAVYTRAAHVIAQWLGERLGPPQAPVVERERGIELLEKGVSWYEKRRACSRA